MNYIHIAPLPFFVYLGSILFFPLNILVLLFSPPGSLPSQLSLHASTSFSSSSSFSCSLHLYSPSLPHPFLIPPLKARSAHYLVQHGCTFTKLVVCAVSFLKGCHLPPDLPEETKRTYLTPPSPHTIALSLLHLSPFLLHTFSLHSDHHPRYHPPRNGRLVYIIALY